MPAQSKAQQRFMGMVHAAQKGETPSSPEVAKVAKDMDKSDAKDFASTSHKGLPSRVKKEILNRLKNEYGLMLPQHHIKPAALAQSLDDLEGVNENIDAEEINSSIIPAALKVRFDRALELTQGKELSYNQKIKLLAMVIDSLGVDKAELSKISSKIKTNLD
jgi:hypothetical protein